MVRILFHFSAAMRVLFAAPVLVLVSRGAWASTQCEEDTLNLQVKHLDGESSERSTDMQVTRLKDEEELKSVTAMKDADSSETSSNKDMEPLGTEAHMHGRSVAPEAVELMKRASNRVRAQDLLPDLVQSYDVVFEKLRIFNSTGMLDHLEETLWHKWARADTGDPLPTRQDMLNRGELPATPSKVWTKPMTADLFLKEHGLYGANFARMNIDDSMTGSHGVMPPLALLSRKGGVHFFDPKVSDGQLDMGHVGSFVPSCYFWEKNGDGGLRTEYREESTVDCGDMFPVSFEGAARFGNIFVAVAVCFAAEDVDPSRGETRLIEYRKCPMERDAGAPAEGNTHPALFIFDTTLTDWKNPKPQHVLPLYGVDAALHVDLVVTPTGESTEGLYAVVTSGFHAGKGGIACLFTSGFHAAHAGLYADEACKTSGVSAIKIASRGRRDLDDFSPRSGPQRTSSWGGSLQGQAAWANGACQDCFHVDLAAVNSLAVQEQRTVWFGQMESCVYPEGSLIWHSDPGNAADAESLVSCVNGRGAFRVYLGLPAPGTFQERTMTATLLDSNVGYQQLVGKSMMVPSGADSHDLTAVTSNWAPRGGVNNFQWQSVEGGTAVVDVSGPRGLGYQFQTSNRVILVTEPAHAIYPRKVFAFVPHEDFSRFSLWDTTNAKAPCLVGMGVIAEPGITHHDTCLPGSFFSEKCPKTMSRDDFTYSMEVVHPADPDGDESYFALLFTDGNTATGGKTYAFDVGPASGWICPSEVDYVSQWGICDTMFNPQSTPADDGGAECRSLCSSAAGYAHTEHGQPNCRCCTSPATQLGAGGWKYWMKATSTLHK